MKFCWEAKRAHERGEWLDGFYGIRRRIWQNGKVIHVSCAILSWSSKNAYLAAVLVFFLMEPAKGEVIERLASNNISPDGNYEVVEVGELNPLLGNGYEVQLRDRKMKSILGKRLYSYGSLKVAGDFPKVMWDSNHPFVAIEVRVAKRNFETTIFYLDGALTREVKPGQDYFQNICGRLGTLGNDFRNTRETPVRFIPGKMGGSNLILKVEVPSLTEDLELAFEVTLACYPPRSDYNGGDPEPHVSIINITGPVKADP